MVLHPTILRPRLGYESYGVRAHDHPTKAEGEHGTTAHRPRRRRAALQSPPREFLDEVIRLLVIQLQPDLVAPEVRDRKRRIVPPELKVTQDVILGETWNVVGQQLRAHHPRLLSIDLIVVIAIVTIHRTDLGRYLLDMHHGIRWLGYLGHVVVLDGEHEHHLLHLAIVLHDDRRGHGDGRRGSTLVPHDDRRRHRDARRSRILGITEDPDVLGKYPERRRGVVRAVLDRGAVSRAVLAQLVRRLAGIALEQDLKGWFLHRFLAKDASHDDSFMRVTLFSPLFIDKRRKYCNA